MTMAAYSICAITDQTASLNHTKNPARPVDFASSYVLGKCAQFHGKPNFARAVFKVKTAHFCGRQIRDLSPRHVLFAIPNRNYDASRGISYGSYDELADEDSCDIEGFKEPETEAVGSSQLGLCLSQNVVNLQNQGDLLDKLKAVHLHLLAMEQLNASRLKLCHRKYIIGATNLIHYVALRSLDIEHLSEDLSFPGLLNLGTNHSCVLPSLSAGIRVLENLKLSSFDVKQSEVEEIPVRNVIKEIEMGKQTIDLMKKTSLKNRESLFGSLRDGRTSHIMVTVGAEVLESNERVTELIKAGASVIRINCAHGDPSIWSEIIRRVKISSQMLETPCRVLMDLAGPKLRTGKLNPGPHVIKLSPEKNASGEVICPAHVWLCNKISGPLVANLHPDAVVHIEGQEFLSKLELGDVIEFLDSRGKQRILKITHKITVFSGVGFLAECSRTAYIHSGAVLSIKEKKKKSDVGIVIDVPAVEQFVRLKVGDLLTISREISSDQKKITGFTKGAHRIHCPCVYLFDSVKPGEPIAFDDGKIWGVIQGTSNSEIIVSITHAGLKGSKLGSEKSINIPQSNIRFDGLTSKDLVDLDFVSSHADMVGVSFIRSVNDIVLLRQELEKRKVSNLGVVLKIETKGGFENLPLMLLEAMKCGNPLGVMIARGDLAVECGWERLGDIQEEIISICDAAHIPVIWATQVLESLVKAGVPTRAEITDVANGKKVSCIMLNKGKHIVEAISTLDTMLDHKSKLELDLKPLF